MTERPLITGVIGAGAISDAYLINLTGIFKDYTDVRYISANHLERATVKAEKYGLIPLTTDDLISKDDIELVIILTPVETHYELIRRCLMAGKHVYCEKTITLFSKEAEELIELAKQKNLYLGSAPDTFLGSMIQSARKAIDENMIGDIHSFGILINRNNDILTSMFRFLRQPGAGILRDYVVYYLTAVVSLLGEVEQVAAFSAKPYMKRRAIIPGTDEFMKEIETPNEAVVAVTLKMKNGIIGTIHDDSESSIMDHSVFNIYGHDGILKLGNANNFGDDVAFIKAIMDYRNPEPPVILEKGNAYSDNMRGLGACEMVEAINSNRRQRADARMALHVLKVLEAIEESAESGKFIRVDTDFNRPDYFSGL